MNLPSNHRDHFINYLTEWVPKYNVFVTFPSPIPKRVLMKTVSVSSIPTARMSFQELDDVVYKSLGWKKAHLYSVYKNSFYVSFATKSPMEFVMEAKVYKANTKVSLYAKYPCNGLPLENHYISVVLGSKGLEAFRVPNDTDVSKVLKKAQSIIKSNVGRLNKEHAKKARASLDAKALWMCTI